MAVDVETIVISGFVGIVTSAITAYFTSKLKVSEERDKWYRDLANKYAEALETNPAIAAKLATQFAIALIIVEGRGHRIGKRNKFFVLPSTRLVVGRGSSCDIVIDDPAFSWQQVSFFADSSEIFLETLGAANPIVLNGEILEGRTRLKNSDEVIIGETRFELVMLS